GVPSSLGKLKIVTLMLSFRSDVEQATVLDTWTVLTKTTLVSHAVVVMVSEVEVRSVTVPRTAALVPGAGEGAPGLGHAAASPPRVPAPPPKLPPVRDVVFWAVVLALTLF